MEKTTIPDSWLKCQLLSLRADLARAKGQLLQAVLDLHEEVIHCLQVYGNRMDELEKRARLVEFFLETNDWKRALTDLSR